MEKGTNRQLSKKGDSQQELIWQHQLSTPTSGQKPQLRMKNLNYHRYHPEIIIITTIRINSARHQSFMQISLFVKLRQFYLQGQTHRQSQNQLKSTHSLVAPHHYHQTTQIMIGMILKHQPPHRFALQLRNVLPQLVL